MTTGVSTTENGHSEEHKELRYRWVPALNLSKTAEGQGFLLHISGGGTANAPLFGIVEDPEREIISLRKSTIGAPIRSYLHLIGEHRQGGMPDEAELARMEAYYKAVHTGGATSFAPTPLRPPYVAHFVEVDANNEAVKISDHSMVTSLGVVAVELAEPIVGDTLDQYER